MLDIHSSGQTIFGFSYMKGITLDADEEVAEVGGGASGIGVDRVEEFGSRASEGQILGVYGTGSRAGMVVAQGCSRETGEQG